MFLLAVRIFTLGVFFNSVERGVGSISTVGVGGMDAYNTNGKLDGILLFINGLSFHTSLDGNI